MRSDLRHTAASLAISAGANVKAFQRMLGHASAAMTLDTYADLFDDDLDSVAQAPTNARQGVSVVSEIPSATPDRAAVALAPAPEFPTPTPEARATDIDL